MKIFRWFIFFIEGLFIIALVWCIFRICFSGGTKADDILSAVDLDLPKYEITSTDDNLDRGASRWDSFLYIVSFSPNEANNLTETLNGNGWEKKNGEFWKDVEVNEDLVYSAQVIPSKGLARLEVEIDESYGFLELTFVIFLNFIVMSVLGTIYGIAWLVVKFIRKRKEAQDA